MENPKGIHSKFKFIPVHLRSRMSSTIQTPPIRLHGVVTGESTGTILPFTLPVHLDIKGIGRFFVSK
jgi:hypothetical protein